MRLVDKVTSIYAGGRLSEYYQVELNLLPAVSKAVAFQLELVDSSNDERNQISPCCEVVFL